MRDVHGRRLSTKKSHRQEAGGAGAEKPPEGFDPPTCSLRNCRSAGLSYGGASREEKVLRHKHSEVFRHRGQRFKEGRRIARPWSVSLGRSTMGTGFARGRSAGTTASSWRLAPAAEDRRSPVG